MSGAKVVARAWTDPAYRGRLLADGTAAIAELGISGPEGAHMVVVENTPEVHNVIVCTLCSCYPWPVLGAPPNWYKDPAYRSRVVREPRVVLREMGCAVPDALGIRVWDSSAEVRYLVIPERPAGHGGPERGEAGRPRNARRHDWRSTALNPTGERWRDTSVRRPGRRGVKFPATSFSSWTDTFGWAAPPRGRRRGVRRVRLGVPRPRTPRELCRPFTVSDPHCLVQPDTCTRGFPSARGAPPRIGS